ncbi:tail collar domain [Anaerobacterium chartisolvens]|uniref:Tail collar domain n=1 Tax=Anaerobacterium chartisolvens TaxID=1297424 RepID=A0A369BGB6_9FIRM|nr:tail fiber protein [Anaerobacterium chartisolvens]RCX18734.1 tail collar domain [Anaerobacterium chartisolvens]
MDAILSQIQLFPFTFEMMGWMSCQGQTLQIMQNQALFSLIGATYGGDGRTTFCLPNLKGAEPLPGTRYYIATEGLYPQRQ